MLIGQNYEDLNIRNFLSVEIDISNSNSNSKAKVISVLPPHVFSYITPNRRTLNVKQTFSNITGLSAKLAVIPQEKLKSFELNVQVTERRVFPEVES